MSEPLMIFTDEEKDLIYRTKGNAATRDEFETFLHIAQRCGLDPRANQIYLVKRQGKGTIQVGIDGLRLVADRTGKYAGSDDAEMIGETPDGKYPAAAKVTVWKMVEGQRCPFSATARWAEYYPGDAAGMQWKKMPCVMISKVAEALALRKAFPADLSGLYTNEEMDQAGGSDAPPSGSPAPIAPKPAPPLTGAALVEAAKEAFSDPDSLPTRGDGKVAFGYVPDKWPIAKMFTEPATESQDKMARAKARERMLDLDELGIIRRLVLEAYGLEDDRSKATMSLFIDWLINGDDDALDRASALAEAQPRPPLELS